MTIQSIPEDMQGAEEQSTGKFRVLTKFNGDTELVTIRIDRAKGSGLANYDTLVLTAEEAEALRIALANELD